MTSTPYNAGRKNGKWNFIQRSVSYCESPTNAVIQEGGGVHGHILKTTDTAKYLEVELHNKLRWQKHTHSTAHKADATRAFQKHARMPKRH